MAKLTLSYLAPNGDSRFIFFPDAEAEPDMAAAVKAAGDDEPAKMDAIIGWFAKNPRKVESADIGGVDEATARRYAKVLAAPTLRLSVEKIKGEWLVAEHADRLVDLEIDDLSAFDRSLLAKLPKLRRFSFFAYEVTDLAFLAAMPALEEVNVGGGAEPLSFPKLPRLKTLRVYGGADVAEGGLAGLTGLTSLTVDGARIRNKAGVLPALERLHYEVYQEPLDPAFFKGSPALKSVSGNLLNIPEGEKVSLEILAPCASTLEAIDLSMNEVTGLAALAKMPKLRSLALYSSKAPGVIDLAKLKLTGLTTLKAHGQLTVANLDAAPRLTELSVATIDDLEAVASLNELERIQIHKGKGLSLKPLAGLKKLTTVDVGYETRPTAKMIEPLATRAGLQLFSKLGSRDVSELYGELTGKVKVAKQADHARPSFALKGKKGDPGGTKSHSFGTPWLDAKEKWPACGNCKKPMPCLLQLDLKPLKGWKGFLQVFYCTNTEPHCEVVCKTWEGAGPSMLLRIVTPGKKSAAVAPKDLPKAKAQAITADKKAAADVPGQDDAEALGVKDAPKEPKKGDKLGGWPHWLQGPEWPACADCSKKMTLLAQLSSNKAVAHQWGDVGYAYVFACAEHRERLGFCWASG